MLDRLRHRDSTTEAGPPPGTPRILLIDDDPDELDIVRDSLARTGSNYYVEHARSYEAGLERLAAGGYEAALVDYRLGGWTGLDVLREARDRGNRVPLIMMTSERDSAIDMAASGYGAVDFLRKGKTTADELERAVRFAAANGRALETARRAEAQTRALEEVGRYLGSAGTTREALDKVVGIISERFERPFLSLYLAAGDRFRLAGQRGHGAVVDMLDREALAGALRAKRPWLMEAVSVDAASRSPGEPRIEMCIPLLNENQVMGVLLVAQFETNPIGEAEQAGFLSAAGIVAGAVSAASDRRETAGRALRLQRIAAFVSQLSQAPSEAALFASLGPAVAAALDVDTVVISEIAGDNLSVVSAHGSGVPEAGAVHDGDALDQAAAADGRAASVARGTRMVAALPMVRAGSTVGVVHLEREDRAFDSFDREAMQIVATLLGLLLSRSS